MQIVKCREGSWSEAVNFVDENNIVVGYDMAQDCCEYASWYFYEGDVRHEDGAEIDVAGLVFDASYEFTSEEGEPDAPGLKPDELDMGGAETFRLHGGGRTVFLVLINCHNGYYSHGFEMKRGEEIIKDGSL